MQQTNEGFLGSFLSKSLKTNQLELNTDEKTLRPIARLKEPRDLFALPKNKDNDDPLQAPRWPIECQVIQERIIHMSDAHAKPEPYNTPGGLKPRPVGEESGMVVFNYNPISAVNYEKPQKKPRESSDSDISSSESRASSLDRNAADDKKLLKTTFSQLFSALSQRSSSNSIHDEDDDDDDDEVNIHDDIPNGDDSNASTPVISEASNDDPDDYNNNTIPNEPNNQESRSCMASTQTSDTIDAIATNNSSATPISTNSSSVRAKLVIPATATDSELMRLLHLDNSSISSSSDSSLSSANDAEADNDDHVKPNEDVKTVTAELVKRSEGGKEADTESEIVNKSVKTPTSTAKPTPKAAPKTTAKTTATTTTTKSPLQNPNPAAKSATKDPARTSVKAEPEKKGDLQEKSTLKAVASSGINTPTNSVTTTTTTAAAAAAAKEITPADLVTKNKPPKAVLDTVFQIMSPVLNEEVMKLYNGILSQPTPKTDSGSNETKSKMYIDLNVKEPEYKYDFVFDAPKIDSALKHQEPEHNINPLPSPQFSRSAVGGAKNLTNCHPYNADEYDGLEFESRFESGNLAKAVRISKSYYELYLRPDLYTNRSKQWFYFRVKRTKKDIIYRFSIVNLVKTDSLYNEGMRPLMYSVTRAKQIREGWRRCGENVCYYRNDDEPPASEEDDDSSYTLTFNVEFPHDDDTVYLAHSYPYTYSDLQDYLMAIQRNPVKSKFCKLRILCRTLAGNNVYYLTVTAPAMNNEAKRKKCIVVSARVHPSEAPASWMMKGLMDYITGDSWIAKRLRQRFVFKLIPMLNPDGVIVGNTRNSLTGRDLNRQYRTVIRETYPSIWYTKALIKRLIEECGVAMYCDMHAHSRKQNIFLYGCENKRNPEKKLTEQVFPLMMHKNSADLFSFESCKFKVQRNKEGTGRIVVWLLGITNSYTIEASFGGSSLGGRRGTHFNTADYENIGRTFCETLLDYYDDHPSKVKKLEKLFKQIKKIRRREKREKKVLRIKKMADQGCIINEKIKVKRLEKSVSE